MAAALVVFWWEWSRFNPSSQPVTLRVQCCLLMDILSSLSRDWPTLSPLWSDLMHSQRLMHTFLFCLTLSQQTHHRPFLSIVAWRERKLLPTHQRRALSLGYFQVDTAVRYDAEGGGRRVGWWRVEGRAEKGAEKACFSLLKNQLSFGLVPTRFLVILHFKNLHTIKHFGCWFICTFFMFVRLLGQLWPEASCDTILKMHSFFSLGTKVKRS